jgi:hypothetical protein
MNRFKERKQQTAQKQKRQTNNNEVCTFIFAFSLTVKGFWSYHNTEIKVFGKSRITRDALFFRKLKTPALKQITHIRKYRVFAKRFFRTFTQPIFKRYQAETQKRHCCYNIMFYFI